MRLVLLHRPLHLFERQARTSLLRPVCVHVSIAAAGVAADSGKGKRIESLHKDLAQSQERVAAVAPGIRLGPAPDILDEVELRMKLGQEDDAVTRELNDLLDPAELREEIGLLREKSFSGHLRQTTSRPQSALGRDGARALLDGQEVQDSTAAYSPNHPMR